MQDKLANMNSGQGSSLQYKDRAEGYMAKTIRLQLVADAATIKSGPLRPSYTGGSDLYSHLYEEL
jgi:hypothetical protein